MIGKKLGAVLATAAIAGSTIALTATAAGATHTHVRHVGNGSCVVLGGDGHEDEVVLPAVVAGAYPATRQHPLHVLVHMGEPGQHGTIQVLGADTCTDFVN